MNFKIFFYKSANEIDKELEVFFKEWSTDIEQISPRLLPLTNSFIDACRGGKRIRGTLVRLGFEMGNGKGYSVKGIASRENKEIVKVAIAYEIFQAAILAHDDIIDKSMLRRGMSSLYASLGGGHSGNSKAICLGDIGFFLAFQLIAESDFPENVKNNALVVFSKSMLETGLGELLDVELSQNENHLTKLQDIITVYTLKTAYYTITAPLLIGGILGSLENTYLKKIKIFGRNLGIAFQMQDDINDIFSEKKRLGKETGGDIKEGKQTLLFVFAKEHANQKQKKILEKYYGNPKITQKEIEMVRDVFMKSGALEYVSSQAASYTKKAKESVPEITKDEEFRGILLEMTEYFAKNLG